MNQRINLVPFVAIYVVAFLFALLGAIGLQISSHIPTQANAGDVAIVIALPLILFYILPFFIAHAFPRQPLKRPSLEETLKGRSRAYVTFIRVLITTSLTGVTLLVLGLATLISSRIYPLFHISWASDPMSRFALWLIALGILFAAGIMILL